MARKRSSSSLAVSVEPARWELRTRLSAAGLAGATPLARGSEVPVPDRIHPAMKTMQPAALHARSDLILGEAKRIEFRGRDHPVLTSGELGDGVRSAARGEFPVHIAGK